jgi:hypothetical protein
LGGCLGEDHPQAKTPNDDASQRAALFLNARQALCNPSRSGRLPACARPPPASTTSSPGAMAATRIASRYHSILRGMVHATFGKIFRDSSIIPA